MDLYRLFRDLYRLFLNFDRLFRDLYRRFMNFDRLRKNFFSLLIYLLRRGTGWQINLSTESCIEIIEKVGLLLLHLFKSLVFFLVTRSINVSLVLALNLFVFSDLLGENLYEWSRLRSFLCVSRNDFFDWFLFHNLADLFFGHRRWASTALKS